MSDPTENASAETTTTEPMQQPEMQVDEAASKGELVTERDARRAPMAQITASAKAGGIAFQNMLQVMDFARLMAQAGTALPPHLRGNPGGCLAATLKAVHWDMDPFVVANWQYEVDNRGVKRVAYESQCYHAVLEARGPFKDRLNWEIFGEGDERRCRIWATLRGEDKPREFISDTLGKLRPERNDRGQVKGSPLWDKKPDVQLFYNASRDFARIFCPDVMAGVYTREELEEMGPEHAIEVNPTNGGGATGLHDRLKAEKANGSHEEGFREGEAHTVLEGSQGEQAPAGKGAGGKGVTQRKPRGTRTTAAPTANVGPSEEKPPAATHDTVAAEQPNTPQAPATPPKAAPTPKNVKQYRQWVLDWLKDHADVEEIETRWMSERKLRNACGLVESDRLEIKEHVDKRIAELGG